MNNINLTAKQYCAARRLYKDYLANLDETEGETPLDFASYVSVLFETVIK